VLLVTVKPLVTVSEDGKVTAHALARRHPHVRKRTALARAAAVVGEMQAERRAFGRRLVRQIAGVGVVRTVAL
jgi:hypothetical protein